MDCKSITVSLDFQYAPCMDYLPTSGDKWLQSSGVGWVTIAYMEHSGLLDAYVEFTGLYS